MSSWRPRRSSTRSCGRCAANWTRRTDVRRDRMKLLPWIVTPLLVVTIVAVWHVVVTAGEVNPLVFPPPAEVGAALVELLSDPGMWAAARITVTEVVLGFLIAVLTGLV